MLQHRTLALIRSALICIRSKTIRQLYYKLDVNSHRVTLDCIIRVGLKKGVRYRPEVCVPLREYGNAFIILQYTSFASRNQYPHEYLRQRVESANGSNGRYRLCGRMAAQVYVFHTSVCIFLLYDKFCTVN